MENTDIFLLVGNQPSFLQATVSDQPSVDCGFNSVKFLKSLQCYLDLSHMCTTTLPIWYLSSGLTHTSFFREQICCLGLNFYMYISKPRSS